MRSTLVGDDIVFVRFHQQRATVETTPVKGGETRTVAELNASMQPVDFLEPEGMEAVWMSATDPEDGSRLVLRVDLVDGTVEEMRGHSPARPTAGGSTPGAGALLGSVYLEAEWSLYHPNRAALPVARDAHVPVDMTLSPDGEHIAALFTEEHDRQDERRGWVVAVTKTADVLAGSPVWIDAALPGSFADAFDNQPLAFGRATNPLTWATDGRILINALHEVGLVDTP